MDELDERIWTEEEVLDLPSEHDKYERKAGKIFESEWKETLAKEVCAFANSFGGYIALGIEEGKKNKTISVDGVEAYKGNEPFNEWLEKQIPDLLFPPLQNFSVLPVEPAETNSEIPEGKALFMISIGDSDLAPHQTTDERKSYFHRSGSRSIPAHHVYLEGLRNRKNFPSSEVVQAWFHTFLNDLITCVESVTLSFEDREFGLNILNYEPLKVNLELPYDQGVSNFMGHRNTEQFLLTNPEINAQLEAYKIKREGLNLKISVLSKKISDSQLFIQVFRTTFGREVFGEQYVFRRQISMSHDNAEKLYDKISEITGFYIDEGIKSTLNISTFSITQLCDWEFRSGDGKLGKFWEKYKKMYRRVGGDPEISQFVTEFNLDIESTKNLLKRIYKELKKKRHDLSLKYGVPYSKN